MSGRKRLTSRVAAEVVGDKGSGIMNDPYQVNNPEHEKNDPSYQEYAKGDPEAWAEGVNKDNLWKQDKRIETNHPAITAKMAAEAVQSARKLEARAVKCIVASQRMLPGASEQEVEAQACDLLSLPENQIDALLSRQEKLANMIAGVADETATEANDEAQQMEEAKKVLAAKKEAAEKAAAEAADLEKALEAGELPPWLKKDKDDEKKEEGEEKEEKEEKKEEAEEKEAKECEEKKEEAEEKKEEAEEEKAATEEAPAAEGEEKKEENPPATEMPETKEAGANLLDDIFSVVTASDSKQGAKSLEGMVKKASEGGPENLSDMWRTDPDVSTHFQ